MKEMMKENLDAMKKLLKFEQSVQQMDEAIKTTKSEIETLIVEEKRMMIGSELRTLKQEEIVEKQQFLESTMDKRVKMSSQLNESKEKLQNHIKDSIKKEMSIYKRKSEIEKERPEVEIYIKGIVNLEKEIHDLKKEIAEISKEIQNGDVSRIERMNAASSLIKSDTARINDMKSKIDQFNSYKVLEDNVQEYSDLEHMLMRVNDNFDMEKEVEIIEGKTKGEEKEDKTEQTSSQNQQPVPPSSPKGRNEYDWGNLTEEQIDELWAEGITPDTQEFRQATGNFVEVPHTAEMPKTESVQNSQMNGKDDDNGTRRDNDNGTTRDNDNGEMLEHGTNPENQHPEADNLINHYQNEIDNSSLTPTVGKLEKFAIWTGDMLTAMKNFAPIRGLRWVGRNIKGLFGKLARKLPIIGKRLSAKDELKNVDIENEEMEENLETETTPRKETQKEKASRQADEAIDVLSRINEEREGELGKQVKEIMEEEEKVPKAKENTEKKERKTKKKEEKNNSSDKDQETQDLEPAMKKMKEKREAKRGTKDNKPMEPEAKKNKTEKKEQANDVVKRMEEAMKKIEEAKSNPWRNEEAAQKVGTKEGVERIVADAVIDKDGNEIELGDKGAR